MQMNIVAIGAHPDDLEIFTFGFLAAASARGDTLYLGVATDGAAGGENPGPALATQRANETSTALAPTCRRARSPRTNYRLHSRCHS